LPRLPSNVALCQFRHLGPCHGRRASRRPRPTRATKRVAWSCPNYWCRHAVTYALNEPGVRGPRPRLRETRAAASSSRRARRTPADVKALASGRRVGRACAETTFLLGGSGDAEECAVPHLDRSLRPARKHDLGRPQVCTVARATSDIDRSGRWSSRYVRPTCHPPRPPWLRD